MLEEVYFRGFLLPRIPQALGRTAPLVHTVLFAVYHVWTPWLAPTDPWRAALTYVTLRTRSVVPGIVAHVVLNLLDVMVIVCSSARGTRAQEANAARASLWTSVVGPSAWRWAAKTLSR